tara:strand:+ start:381 stop:737 length:357 start_codon:yes stop_codon:yes gene_type:complete
MSKFQGFRTASSNILKAFGGQITYQQIASGIYNDSLGTVSELITEHTINGFIENIKKSEVNELVQQNDKKLTITRGDISFEPTPTDKVVIAGVTYSVIAVDKDMVEGQDINYFLYLRA